MPNMQKIFIIFFAIFIGLSFFQKTSAATYTASCSGPLGGGACDSWSDTTIDTTGISKVELDYNYFDDGGYIQITKPSGAVDTSLTYAPSPCAGSLPTQDITSKFNEGPGPYIVRAMANSNVCGTNVTATATFITTIAPAACTIAADSTEVLSGDPVILSWTASNATSGNINGSAVSAAELAAGSGSMTTSITSNTTFSMSVTGTGGGGSCGPVTVQVASPPLGGFVPCGRVADNPITPYNEKDPCTLCHIFIMLQIISTFILEIGSMAAAFFLIIGGLIYATSGGNVNRMEVGKQAMKWAIFGLAIIFLSWLIVTIILTAFGYINPLSGNWNILNCSVT